MSVFAVREPATAAGSRLGALPADASGADLWRVLGAENRLAGVYRG
ncbi:hypothetical protein G3I64_30660, partial [Streptomyces sp. SID8499]|nr:hypothetical protein [Streptomyces sp. SID8499]